jgi:hypothetical protein
MRARITFGSPAVKLGAFVVVLGLALAGGFVVGATVGPDPSTGDEMLDHATTASAASPDQTESSSGEHDSHGGVTDDE